MLDHSTIKSYQTLFESKLQDAKDLQSLENLRVEFLGKKGIITQALQGLSSLSLEDKKHLGNLLHPLKVNIQNLIKSKQSDIQSLLQEKKLSTQRIDVTLPGISVFAGSLHPVSKIIRRIEQIFHSLGFTSEQGSEIETEYYNFDALNIPSYHPARTEGDTFFINKIAQQVLRTQTSGVQIRTMEKYKPPIAIIAPGLCYRKDEIDATHLPLFHQVEGLFINKKVSFADLKGVLTFFAQQLFGETTKVRFRPDFFPFTEPSAEVAFSCPSCKGSANECSVCKKTGYVEVAGCGMVHPTVLKNGGIDPDVYSGYAFGFGIERLAMIYFGIPDIRILYNNNPQILSEFNTPLF